MHLILQAKQIPSGTTVFKVTGSQEYTLRRTINLFLKEGQQRSIEAEDATVFLVSKTGDINSFSGEKELKVELNAISSNLGSVIEDALVQWRSGIVD